MEPFHFLLKNILKYIYHSNGFKSKQITDIILVLPNNNVHYDFLRDVHIDGEIRLVKINTKIERVFQPGGNYLTTPPA